MISIKQNRKLQQNKDGKCPAKSIKALCRAFFDMQVTPDNYMLFGNSARFDINMLFGNGERLDININMLFGINIVFGIGARSDINMSFGINMAFGISARSDINIAFGIGARFDINMPFDIGVARRYRHSYRQNERRKQRK